MSDSQQYEQVSVSSDGVTVDKRFEEDEFPVPAIAFEIRSERSETVTIVLTDTVPDGVAVEDLGFHPEYGSEYWTIDEDQITFEREIEAGSEYTTVYGIRATGTDNVEQFLTEPVIEEVDPPLEEEDVVSEDGSDVVRDVISGDSEAVPGLEDDEPDADDEDVATLNLKDPNEPNQPSGETADGDGEGDAESVTLEEASAESLVGALAAEIRNGEVDGEDVKLLRKAFDLAAEDSGSVDARIQRLQTEVADLLAYTDALEEFLDENGMGDEIVTEVREELDAVMADLENVQQMASGHEQALSDIRDTVDAVESSMNSMEADMNEVLEEVDAVQGDVESVRGDVDGVREDVEGVESEVGEVRGELDSVQSTVDEMETTVDDVESTVDAVESDLEELETQVGDIDVSGVREDIDDIEDEIEALKEWREQLSSVIGG